MSDQFMHLALALIVALSPLSVAAKGLQKQSITRASKDGVVMFTAPVIFGDYQFTFSPFVDGGDTVRGTEFVAVKSNDIAVPEGLGILKIHRMPMGSYVLRIVTMQGYWGACLSDDTFKFDIRAGQVTYIGRVDPMPTLTSILAEAARSGKTTSRGGQLRLFDQNVRPPVFTFDGAASVEQLNVIAKANGFTSDAPIIAQQPIAARFRRADITGIAYCK